MMNYNEGAAKMVLEDEKTYKILTKVLTGDYVSADERLYLGGLVLVLKSIQWDLNKDNEIKF